MLDPVVTEENKNLAAHGVEMSFVFGIEYVNPFNQTCSYTPKERELSD